MESLVPLIVQVGLKLINYFRSTSGQSATRPKAKIDQGTVGRLIEMYSALTKADEQLYLYSRLIAGSTGNPREILIQNFRDFYFDRIHNHLDTFLTVLNGVSSEYPQIPDMVKSKSCGSRESAERQLEQQLGQYKQVSEGGGKFNAQDITNLIDAFKAATSCYSEGVVSSLKEILAH